MGKKSNSQTHALTQQPLIRVGDLWGKTTAFYYKGYCSAGRPLLQNPPKEPLSLYLPLQMFFSVETFRDRKEGPLVGPSLVSRLCAVDRKLPLSASASLWSRTAPWALSLRAGGSMSSLLGPKAGAGIPHQLLRRWVVEMQIPKGAAIMVGG